MRAGECIGWCAVGALLACGGRANSGDEAALASGCAAGSQRACACPGRVLSVEQCNADGSYADCRCPSSGGSPSSVTGGALPEPSGAAGSGASVGGAGGALNLAGAGGGGAGGTSAGGSAGATSPGGGAGSSGTVEPAPSPYIYGDLTPCDGESSTVFLDGDGGDYIHAGREWLTDVGLTDSESRPDLVSVSSNSMGAEQAPWFFYFSSEELAAPLAAQQYLAAERWPFESAARAGLSVSGASRGCNVLSGKFAIAQILWQDDTLVRFKVAFEQRCEQGSAALRGCLYYESGLGPATPGPDAGTD